MKKIITLLLLAIAYTAPIKSGLLDDLGKLAHDVEHGASDVIKDGVKIGDKVLDTIKSKDGDVVSIVQNLTDDASRQILSDARKAKYNIIYGLDTLGKKVAAIIVKPTFGTEMAFVLMDKAWPKIDADAKKAITTVWKYASEAGQATADEVVAAIKYLAIGNDPGCPIDMTSVKALEASALGNPNDETNPNSDAGMGVQYSTECCSDGTKWNCSSGLFGVNHCDKEGSCTPQSK